MIAKYLDPSKHTQHLSSEQKVEFLKLMREGISIAEAARRMKVHRSHMTKARKVDLEFGAAVEQALDDTNEIRQQAAVARSRAGHVRTKIPQSGLSDGLKKISKYIDPFLDALAHGASPTRAAELAEIAPSTALQWKREDPSFAQRWAEAIQQGNDRLEDEALRRAVEGYNPRPVFDREGNKVCEIRDYSDTLLMQRLRGRMPETYNRPDLSVSTKVEVRLTREQAAERLQQFGLPVPQLTTEYDDGDGRTNNDGSEHKQ